MSSIEGEVSCFAAKLDSIKKSIIENFLLFSFAIAVTFALSYPAAGKLFHSWSAGPFALVELLNYVVVFFVSGFTLKLEELKQVLKYKVPIIYSLVMINFITTLLGFGLIKFPFLIDEFRIGEVIFASVPTTLGEISIFCSSYIC